MDLGKMLKLGQGSGVLKRKGNVYTNTVNRLNALLQESLVHCAQLEAANAQLAMQEEVSSSSSSSSSSF